MPVRPNIVGNEAARDAFIEASLALDREFPGPTTGSVGIPGADTPLSTWDLFTLWHFLTMMQATPPGSGRNAAHRGPVFLPWHRWMLLLLESHMQRVLGDTEFGLPYWDWAADGDEPPADQPGLPLWTPDYLGGDGDPVVDGPFAFDPAVPESFRVRIWNDPVNSQLVVVDRGLVREFQRVPTLPTTRQVETALALSTYDNAPFDWRSRGHRNHLEGWRPPNGLHNRVHGWIGGDMGVGTSPNDPAFYLNHCNVDRIWEGWMQRHGRVYRPDDSAPAELAGHRPSDALVSMLTTNAPQVSSMFDLTATYTYDALP